ncbi:TPA: hypothetical protein HA242_03775 [Candidatus Woesearchaeota archaeon]|nr:hypothetical protein [Candidatus Woesearchaeota archaeon]HIG93880.1 hypothetical protein [Candidatus Woesearchaeota archaeon]HIH12815.1 hypothetical protein [Candidatus Woesearchaeota archaeon]
MKNTKASSELWWIIMTAVIVLVVVILVLLWFQGSGEKAFGGINTQLDDADNDKVTNLFDQCPNTPAIIKGDDSTEVDAAGCSQAQRDLQKKESTT